MSLTAKDCIGYTFGEIYMSILSILSPNKLISLSTFTTVSCVSNFFPHLKYSREEVPREQAKGPTI